MAPPLTPVADSTPMADNPSEHRTNERQPPFKHTLGPYPLRSRGAALLTLRARDDKPQWGRNT
eukprot:2229413-Pleurochrysis_carterae.AAC.1